MNRLRIILAVFICMAGFHTKVFAQAEVIPSAEMVDTDVSNFDNNLSSSDTTVQTALETIDDLSLGGGAFTDLTDTPASYSGAASNCVLVKGTEDGVEFGSCAGGASGDNVTVNGTAIDTTANFLDSIYMDFTITDGGAGGPDAVNPVFNYNAASGDHALATTQGAFAANGLVFEGTTADTIELYFAIPDPATTDKVITFFNATDTVVGKATTDTLTNKTLAAADNVIEADTAATVTEAAQTAITSLGTLTTLAVDNITINGNDISSTAGTDLTITPLAGQQIVLDGTIVIDAGVVTGATSITSTAFVGDLTGNADTATTATTATTANNLAADGVDALTEIAQGIKTAANDTSKLVVGTAGAENDCAKWDASGNLVTAGAACGSGGGGAFDDTSDPIVMNTTTKDVVIGTSAVNTSKLTIDGDADQVQLTVQANATQTDSVIIVEQSGTTEVFNVDSDGTVKASASFSPMAADGSTLGTTSLEFSDLFLADGGVINLGNDQDVTLTHVADTGIQIALDDSIMFGDTAVFIESDDDGYLDLDADVGVRINSLAVNVPSATAFPGAPATGDVVVITDDSATGACDSSAGSAVSMCRYNGATWDAIGDGSSGSGAPTDADYLVGTANGSLSAEIVVGTSPGGELGGTWGTPTIDDTGITLTSITIGSLLGVDSIDATGAVDMDYGSADVTDHTFVSDGGTVVIDGTITQDAGTTLFMGGLLDATGAVDMDYGSADITDHTFVTDGTGTAEIVLPAGAIDSTEILDDEIVNADINSAAAIAISKTALTAGRSLTLSTNDLLADAELYTETISLIIEEPVDADSFLFWKAPQAVTITDIHCITAAATSAVIDVQECTSAGATCATVDATITCDSDGAEDDGTLTNGAIDAADWMNLDIGAVTGSVGAVTVTITYTKDD